MPLSKKDSHLTNLPRTHNLTSGSELPTQFSSTLSSLISNSNSTQQPPRKKARTGKDDIFTTHNANASKRAKRDLDPNISGPFAQKHSTDGGALGKDVLERSRRKMEQKARLYKAMKRGEVEDLDEKYEVDFEGERRRDSDTSEDEGEAQEEVEYIDEFGRTRKGTRLDAMRAKQSGTKKDDDRFTARPVAPASGIVYGDTIQHEAFDPDAGRVAQMEALAKKRDRSLTPPPEEYYDAGKEVRTRGTGFMQFSGEKDEREEQMRGLESLRKETEAVRGEGGKGQNAAVEARKKIIEERRRVVEEKRAKRKAEDFLGELSGGAGIGGNGVKTRNPEDMTDRIEDAIRRETDAGGDGD
ncbi:uncharacterized protein RCC_01988 [Ramularia collo-cygni]|uniref:Uncharacterized protein n=1 Tax=Ramularia collo-cygni TaxID=112498 RepID=A0A2D3UVK8_9PEZI|nr:uncharacterized protein RCC_01988 [Ramularia collo-cygni]CZT16147.1 uncharacterized protein RCC_01988 [Ramularia collo-cygni]